MNLSKSYLIFWNGKDSSIFTTFLMRRVCALFTYIIDAIVYFITQCHWVSEGFLTSKFIYSRIPEQAEVAEASGDVYITYEFRSSTW